jgi:hypothetical protein
MPSFGILRPKGHTHKKPPEGGFGFNAIFDNHFLSLQTPGIVYHIRRKTMNIVKQEIKY